MKSPCYKCDKRELHCHSTCSDYISYQEKNERSKNPIEKLVADDFYRSIKSGVISSIKYHRVDNRFH